MKASSQSHAVRIRTMKYKSRQGDTTSNRTADLLIAMPLVSRPILSRRIVVAHIHYHRCLLPDMAPRGTNTACSTAFVSEIGSAKMIRR